jgi:Ca2+-binding RTX toxin-like protein
MQGPLGENTNEIENLTLQVWNDIDVEASGSVVIVADQDVVLQTEGTLIIDRIQAGGDVRITAGGGILNDKSGGQNIISTRIRLFAGLGIGEADHPMSTDVRYIQSESKTGSTWIMNTGALVIGDFDVSDTGMSSGGSIILSASSSITVAEDLTAMDEIILTAEDSSGPSDDLLIVSDVTVRSMDSYIELRAGDDLIIETGATVQALGAVRIYGDYGDADPDVGSWIKVSGTVIGNPVEIFGNMDDDVIDASSSSLRMIIYGGAGDDRMYGGTGDDLMYGGLGDDSMYGNAGNDEMYGGLGDDTMDGGAGDDGMLGDQGILIKEILDGSTETTLTIPGNALSERVNVAGTVKWFASLEDAGVGGNDTMLGGTGNDAMHGGFGNDAMSGDEGNDALFGDLGNDVMNGGADADHMYGGSGDDDMDGGTEADILYGGAGSDYLVADIEGDRLIDWIRPRNTFVTPRKGRPTVIVSPSPWVRKLLLDLATADGATNPSDEIDVVAPGK